MRGRMRGHVGARHHVSMPEGSPVLASNYVRYPKIASLGWT